MPALLHDVMEEMHKGTPVNYVKTMPPVLFPRQAGIYAEVAQSEYGQAVCRMVDFRRGPENHRFSRPRVGAQRFQIEDLDRIGVRQRRKDSAGDRYALSGRSEEVARYLREADLGRLRS